MNAILLAALLVLALTVAGAYAIVRVIVLRPARKAAKALDETSRRLRAIFRAAPDGICLIDWDGKIISCNTRFRELFQLPPDPDEPPGTRFGLPLRFDAADERDAEALRDIQNSGPDGVIARSASGRAFLLRSSAVAGSRQSVAIVTDISHRLRMETELAQARDAAEAASKSKADFLAAMSHEIRTPLNGVIGMADLLAQTSLTKAQRKSLRTIRESSYALLAVINDVLDFSKIEAGRLEIEIIEMPLAETLESAISPLGIAASRKKIRLLCYVDPSLPAMVRGDPARVRQVLLNLCGNAVKFSDAGDVIVRADADPSRPDWIRFSVIDHGIGISEENQKKLFREFSQAETSTTRRYGGTGLGLTISKRLTELMGGTISVSSALGIGTQFSVSLPLPASPAANRAQADEHQSDFSGHQVHLIGRSAEEMRFLSSYLRSRHAEVTESVEPQKLEAMLRTHDAPGTQPELAVFLSDIDPVEVAESISDVRASKDARAPRFLIARDPSLDESVFAGLRGMVFVDTQPLRRGAFIHAVAVGLGLEREGDEIGEGAAVAEALKTSGPLILVAEDNATNQDVIEGQLARLGYRCEVAGDGKRALECLQDKSFAALLTDCHMPIMDGLELAHRIRTEEHERNLPRLPIIAITANALRGEEDRCLAAGMDAYLAKPIDFARLKEVLEKWIPSQLSDAGTSHKETLDLTLLNDTFGDDEAKIGQILKRFIELAHEIASEIDNSVEKHDAQAVNDSGHKLRSSALTTGALALAEACRKLEEAGRLSDWQQIARAHAAIGPALREAIHAIEAKIA